MYIYLISKPDACTLQAKFYSQTGGSQCKIGVPALDIEALQSPDYRIARKPLSNRRTVEHFKESVLRENKSTQTELIK